MGESYLYLQLWEDSVTGRFEVALSDFNEALGLDGSPEAVSEENLESRRPFLESYLRDHLAITVEGAPVPLVFTDLEIGRARGGNLQLAFDLPSLDAVPERMTFDYTFLFEEEHHHRGFVLIEHDWSTGTFANEAGISLVFRPGETRQELDLVGGSRWQGFLAVVRVGAEHIWFGFDHLMFLLALLLPAVLRREEGESSWEVVDRFGPALFQVVKIVTAFTVAHSITLSLAALDVVRLPSQLVEVIIAASIAIAAADLLVPLFRDKLWLVVLVFGLFHGFGFAGALAETGILREHLGLSLFAFNLGVELGQIAIVVVLVPLLYAFRRVPIYRTWALRAAAVGMILISMAWVVERTFEVDIPMSELVRPVVGRLLS